MKRYIIFLLLLMIGMFYPISAQTEKWTVHDVNNKRHWKIISYDHNSLGYSVLMKQIRHYLITKVNDEFIQAEVDYKFCNNYLYKTKNKAEYKLAHQFFSKFGKDENLKLSSKNIFFLKYEISGTIDFPSEFVSDMKNIDSFFENHMRKMLNIPQVNQNKSMITKVKMKSWKYKQQPKDKTDLWTIQSINIYPSCIKMSWKKNDGDKRTIYMMEYAEKYFLMQKLLKKIPSEKLIKHYWTKDDYYPYFNFYLFTLEELGIDSKFLNYEKNVYCDILYEEILMKKLSLQNHPIKNEFLEYLEKNGKNYYKKNIDIAQLCCITEHIFLKKYVDSFNFYFVDHYNNQEIKTPSGVSVHYTVDNKPVTVKKIKGYLKSLKISKGKTVVHSIKKFFVSQVKIDY